MFCPKCGTASAITQKFCRGCGSDLEIVSAALTGALTTTTKKSGKKNAQNDCGDEIPSSVDDLWTSVIRNGLSALAFIAIAIFLTVTNKMGGSVWGFWLLIPGFAMLGTSAASYFKIKRIERRRAEFNQFAATQSVFPPDFQTQQTSLPPPRQSFVNEVYQSPRVTGELVMPPSVTENTTRHLAHETENPTALFQSEKK